MQTKAHFHLDVGYANTIHVYVASDGSIWDISDDRVKLLQELPSGAILIKEQLLDREDYKLARHIEQELVGLPRPGDRVQHVKNPGTLGTVVDIAYHETFRRTPCRVQWDNESTENVWTDEIKAVNETMFEDRDPNELTLEEDCIARVKEFIREAFLRLKTDVQSGELKIYLSDLQYDEDDVPCLTSRVTVEWDCETGSFRKDPLPTRDS